jgi:hypothetical protein
MRIFLVVLFSILIFQIQAQKVVMLHKANGQQKAFYGNQPLSDAYEAASNEDTIYLPGGAFVAPANISKRLTIYGAGHYPDSTQVTGKTIIANPFIIGSDADSLHMEGIEFNGNINVGSDVNYVVLKRNSLQSINWSYLPVSSNNRLEGNIIKGNISTNYATNLLLTNNIVSGQLGYTKNGDVVRNNVFLMTSTNYTLITCLYTLFENNIFLSTLPECLTYAGGDYNTFSNNVFGITPNWSLNTVNNNYINVNVSNLFMNQSGSVFDYLHNYHLQNPGTYLGVDATQCGIYGGVFGYKEGGVPVNPHIRQKTIAGSTDVNGKLNVNINVAAQNN